MGKILNLIESYKKKEEGQLIIGYYRFWVVLTYLSVVSAVFGIRLALGGEIGYALLCLMISGVCDTLDGRVANLKERTDRQKSYGVQIDSLADIISFGVLPVVIGYGLGPDHLAKSVLSFGMIINIGIFSIYLLAALIRLAYFNVIEAELHTSGERRTYYEGLPVTSVALIIPLVYSIGTFSNLDLSKTYNTLLIFISLAFVTKIKIHKPSCLYQFILCLIGIPIIIYIILKVGI